MIWFLHALCPNLHLVPAPQFIVVAVNEAHPPNNRLTISSMVVLETVKTVTESEMFWFSTTLKCGVVSRRDSYLYVVLPQSLANTKRCNTISLWCGFSLHLSQLALVLCTNTTIYCGGCE
jgi:hypothetical protein